MTNDYKEGILKYITGNVSVENEKANSFRDNETITNDLETKLAELGITPSYATKILTSETNSNILVYDEYTKNSKTYSFIAILDQTGAVLDILTTYESGMPIEQLIEINFDENGNIYGIDYPNVPTGETRYYRIVQFNNITIPLRNRYVCKLRSSYYIKSSTFDISTGLSSRTIKKVVGEAKYYIFGYDYSNNNDRKIELISFSNIVGLPTEWFYYYGNSIGNDTLTISNFIIENKTEKQYIDIFFHTTGDGDNIQHAFFDGEQLIQQQIIITPNLVGDIAVENKTTLYSVSQESNGDDTRTVYVYKIDGNSCQEIFNFNIEGAYPYIFLSIVNGILFCKVENSMTVDNTTLYKVKCAAYYDNQAIISPSYDFSNTRLLRTTCNIQKTFNLYTFIVLTAEGVKKPTIIIYDKQYSGESRTNYDTTLPKHAELYSNSYIKFARDLYNRQVYQNQCVSTVNVPYNYLNDIDINPSNLISASMTELESDTNTFTKNQYENVFINYINKINVIDEDTNTLYPSTANYINENINTGNQQNYENSFIGKVKINYPTQDPTIQTLLWNEYSGQYYCEFLIYTSEIPNSFEFMSNDETTTYITKTLDNLDLNSYYYVSQWLKIE